MENLITEQEFEDAIQYFSNLETHLRNNPKEQVVVETVPFVDYAIIAQRASHCLSRYERKELEFLISKGFNIEKTVELGLSQSMVMRLLKGGEPNDSLKKDDFEQAMRVLKNYREIQKYESQVEDYRKLMAVEEAMRKSGF